MCIAVRVCPLCGVCLSYLMSGCPHSMAGPDQDTQERQPDDSNQEPETLSLVTQPRLTLCGSGLSVCGWGAGLT